MGRAVVLLVRALRIFRRTEIPELGKVRMLWRLLGRAK
jgi:hypothetical protein